MVRNPCQFTEIDPADGPVGRVGIWAPSTFSSSVSWSGPSAPRDDREVIAASTA